MAIHNVTESALLTKKSRRTIQRYITQGKVTVTRDTLGNPQIDTAELIRVFGSLSQVAQKKIVKKSHNVTPELSQQNSNNDRIDKLIVLVEKQQDQISQLTASVKALTNRLEYDNNRTEDPEIDIKELLRDEPVKVQDENIRTTKHSINLTKVPEFLKPEPIPASYLDDIPTFGKS
jgi:thiamine kinase-like enzyme